MRISYMIKNDDHRIKKVICYASHVLFFNYIAAYMRTLNLHLMHASDKGY